MNHEIFWSLVVPFSWNAIHVLMYDLITIPASRLSKAGLPRSLPSIGPHRRRRCHRLESNTNSLCATIQYHLTASAKDFNSTPVLHTACSSRQRWTPSSTFPSASVSPPLSSSSISTDTPVGPRFVQRGHLWAAISVAIVAGHLSNGRVSTIDVLVLMILIH